jgi:Flp pilus assembly protein TadG
MCKHSPSWKSASTRIGREEGGQSLVELAVVLPLLLLLLLGIMDFGRAFNYWITETQVASEGARRAAVNLGSSGTLLHSYVRDQIQVGDLRKNATICVKFPDAPDANAATAGHPVQVIVKTPFRWFLSGLVPIELANSATMRLEANSTATPVCVPPA